MRDKITAALKKLGPSSPTTLANEIGEEPGSVGYHLRNMLSEETVKASGSSNDRLYALPDQKLELAAAPPPKGRGPRRRSPRRARRSPLERRGPSARPRLLPRRRRRAEISLPRSPPTLAWCCSCRGRSRSSTTTSRPRPSPSSASPTSSTDMNAPLPGAALAEPKVELIPCAAIAPSETHIQRLRRKRYDIEALKSLTASIVKLGVQQPGIVRKLKALRGLASYELVAGERRWRASRQAGVEHFPAIVRELDDAEVLEVQLVENLQRETLHPLEEAAGYEELMKVGKFNADQVADKVGLSRSWVYSRLNLLKLDGEARTTLEDGRLDVSRALVVATVAQPNQRGEALKLALERGYNNKHTYSVRELRHKIVADKLSMPLTGAPFSMDDAKLLPDMGACTGCRFRTGNCDPEALDPDVCTNLACFHLKVKAAGERTRAAVEEAGHEVLRGEAARKLSPSVKTVYDHIDLDHVCGVDDFPEKQPEPPKDVHDHDDWEMRDPAFLAWSQRERLWQPRTYRALLEGLKYTPVVIEDPKTRAVRQLLPFREAQKLLKKKGIDLPSYYNRKRPTPTKRSRSASEGTEENWKEQQRREREKRELEKSVRLEILKEVFPKVKPKLTKEALATALSSMENYIDDALKALFGHKDLRKLKEDDLARILVSIEAFTDTSQTYGQPKALLALATSVKVDAAGIRKRVIKAAQGKDEKKP